MVFTFQKRKTPGTSRFYYSTWRGKSSLTVITSTHQFKRVVYHGLGRNSQCQEQTHVPEAYIGKIVYTPSVKAFMVVTTLLTTGKRAVQKTLTKLDELIQGCRMAFKSTKSRILALTRITVCSYVYYVVEGQKISDITEQPVKIWRRVFDSSLAYVVQQADVFRTAEEDLKVTDRVPLSGRFKTWILQFVLIPRLMWPLPI